MSDKRNAVSDYHAHKALVTILSFHTNIQFSSKSCCSNTYHSGQQPTSVPKLKKKRLNFPVMCSFKPFFVCHSSTVCFLMTQNDRSICRRRTNMRLAVTVRAQPGRTQQSRSQACGFPVSSTVPSILQSKKAKGL